MKQVIYIILFSISTLIACKSEEEKRKEYENSDAYRNAQQMLQETRERIAYTKRKMFEDRVIRPLQDSIRSLEWELRRLRALGESYDKILDIKQKIIEIERQISEKEMFYTAQEISGNYTEDSILNQDK